MKAAKDRTLKVFLCHASQDKPMVRELCEQFLAEEWIEPWLDQEKILPGAGWEYEIRLAVRDAEYKTRKHCYILQCTLAQDRGHDAGKTVLPNSHCRQCLVDDIDGYCPKNPLRRLASHRRRKEESERGIAPNIGLVSTSQG